MRTVTALRERPGGRVEVELDGAPWRLLPADAVVRTGLSVGSGLDRETARRLAREVRRAEALGVAVRALRHRDLSRRVLQERLRRRGTPEDAGAEALAALERACLVDDARVAAARARALADRGYGDAAIRLALERDGLGPEHVAEALAGLEREPARLERLLERGTDGRMLRRLAARGFDPAALEDVAGFADGAGSR